MTVRVSFGGDMGVDAKVDVVVAIVEQAAAALDVDVPTLEAIDAPLAAAIEHLEETASLIGAELHDGVPLRLDLQCRSDAPTLDGPWDLRSSLVASFFAVQAQGDRIRLSLEVS